MPPHNFLEKYGEPGHNYCKTCEYECQYLLASLETQRFQVQILHEYDSCCYATVGRHSDFLRYEARIWGQLGELGGGRYALAATHHRTHELCEGDKRVLAAASRSA